MQCCNAMKAQVRPVYPYIKTWLNYTLEHLIGAEKKNIRAGSGKQNRTPEGTSNIEALGGGWASLKWLRVFPRRP